MLEDYQLEEWHGGKVRHILRDQIIYLERGQVFKIEGKKFFTFGGASSHDIQAESLILMIPTMPKTDRRKQSPPALSHQRNLLVGTGTAHRRRNAGRHSES